MKDNWVLFLMKAYMSLKIGHLKYFPNQIVTFMS